jgi:hypothetical protein
VLFSREELFKLAPGVVATLVITLVLWGLLSRAAARARRRFQELLRLEESTPSAAHERVFAATQHRLTALRLIVNAARYALFIGAGLLLLNQFGVKLGTLALPAGFLGAALGLGAQSLIKDIVAGVFIIFEGQFAVGDVVSVNGNLGVIEEVGLRVTRLRDDNGQLYFFPNGSIATVAKFPSRHVPLELWLTLEDAAQRARAEQVMEAALATFEARYSVLDASLTPASEEAGDTLHYRLFVRPTRVAIAREKLPLHLAKALERAGIATRDDAPLEITG